ncbi:acyltransferase, partial [Salmonella enterica]|nr:acyltransferase [Salmonella enterica]
MSNEMAELYKNNFFYKKVNLTVSQSLERGSNNLDLVRIIAALMVIFGHSFALTLTPNMQEPFNYFFPFTYSGSIAVKVFFFISGLLVTNSIIKSKSISEFTIARFFRIYPAFAITIILTGIAIGPLAYNGNYNDYINNPGVFNYISHSLFFDTQYFINGVFSGNRDGGSLNGSLWTISIEVSAYSVVLAIFIFTGFKNKLLSNIICLSIIIIPLTDISGLNFITDRNSEAYILPSCFALG